MRIRKGAIRGRVKADLPIVFTREKLSAYGGLELFRRFVDRLVFSAGLVLLAVGGLVALHGKSAALAAGPISPGICIMPLLGLPRKRLEPPTR